MVAHYICGEKGRRRVVRDPAVALNGIDFLEVSGDQRQLSLHFIKTPIPAGIDLENVVIEGGERITEVVVQALSVESDVLEVRVSAAGDYSLYRLRLVNVAGLDPRLSHVQFSFKVNCPSDFDCHTPQPCLPAKFEDPDIDYLARDYASFKQLMLDRLSVVMPDWRERNPADLGIAMVEMLAYVADHLSYFLDAVGTEAYLDTARRRISVRRHARLRDYFMHEGANARAFVTITVEEGSAADGALLQGPAANNQRHGTQMLTRFGSDQAGLSSALLAEALNAGAMVFETLHDLTLHAAHNGVGQDGADLFLHFYTWSDQHCCLPVGATAATLRGPLANLSTGDLLLLEEVRGARTGAVADADPKHRCVVRLSHVEESLDPLDDTPLVEIAWAPVDALPFSLCLSSVSEEGIAIEDVSIARGNVVLVDQGHTRDEQLRFAEDGFSGLALQGSPLTHAVPLPEGHLERPATELRQSKPHQAQAQIRLFEQAGDIWEARRDLLGSREHDRHFVAETEEDGEIALRFGGNVNGLHPEPGAEFTVVYRVGNGPQGNVGAGAIAHVVDAPSGIRSVSNALPAWGGEAPESLDVVRARAPHAFKVQERAVTEADYARVAERHPEVQRAAATLRWTGSWYTVFLTIDRRGGLPVVGDRDFTESIMRHMDRFRMAGHDLEINGPRFVALDIAARICVGPEYFRGEIKAELLERLGSAVMRNGRPAFFHPDRWTFGQSVYLSQIYAAIMEVTGVASAEITRFQRWGRAAAQELGNGELTVNRLEVIRLDNDPNFQENGRLQLEMAGGQ